MSQQAENRWVDWKVWYENHKDDGRDLAKELEFLETMLQGCIELLGLTMRDVQRLEKRNDAESIVIWPPSESRWGSRHG